MPATTLPSQELIDSISGGGGGGARAGTPGGGTVSLPPGGFPSLPPGAAASAGNNIVNFRPPALSGTPGGAVERLPPPPPPSGSASAPTAAPPTGAPSEVPITTPPGSPVGGSPAGFGREPGINDLDSPVQSGLPGGQNQPVNLGEKSNQKSQQPKNPPAQKIAPKGKPGKQQKPHKEPPFKGGQEFAWYRVTIQSRMVKVIKSADGSTSTQTLPPPLEPPICSDRSECLSIRWSTVP